MDLDEVKTALYTIPSEREVSQWYILPVKVAEVVRKHTGEIRRAIDNHEGPGCPLYGFFDGRWQESFRLQTTA